MMDILFFSGLALYFVAAIMQFVGVVFKKKDVESIAIWTFFAGFALQTAYIVVRGIAAKRLPLSNQFEFAVAFAWGVALMGILMRRRRGAEWILAVSMPMAFLITSYAALQPKEINDLMPALRSAWFGLHIGSAVFAYSSFALAGCAGLRYLLAMRKGEAEDSAHLMLIDRFSYKLIALGFLLLTVVILSGAIWAEQAWSAFWTWDPKETWALITWILYAIYLHLRIRKKKSGKVMAWLSVIAIVCVLFTFIGVNMLLPSLHSYA